LSRSNPCHESGRRLPLAPVNRRCGVLPLLRVLAVAATTLICFLSTASGQTLVRVVKLAPFPDPSPEITAAAVNGKMYIFGGLLNTTVKGLVYEYDPATDKWIKKKMMPLPAHHVAAVGYRGKIYVFGGFTGAGNRGWLPINNSWEYDPVKDSWKALAPFPIADGGAVAAEVDGKIYVIGGGSVQPGDKVVPLSARVPHRALATNYMYDPANNTWEARSPMPTARNHTAIGVVNGKIYVLGGRVGSVFVISSNTDVVEEYDPAADSWGYARARMPTPRSGTAFGTYGGKIFVAGGEMLDNQIVGAFLSMEAYEPATDKWEELPPMSIPRNGPAGVVIGNRFYVVSGQMQSGSIGGTALSATETDAYEFSDK
jgi:N-acetylneuraminic acid mutarotase